MASELLDVHGTEPLDEYTRLLPAHADDRSEGRGPGTARRRGYEHDGSRKQLVGLNDDSVPLTALLVPDASGNVEPVHVASLMESMRAPG